MTLHNRLRFTRALLSLLALCLSLITVRCQAQRDSFNKYSAYVGFSNINAPFVNNLNQPGLGVQFGMAHNRWLETGFDYSFQTGTGPLTPGVLTKNLQMGLKAALPPGYNFRVPTDVNLETFGGGTQLTYRRFGHAPMFFHPVITVMKIQAKPHPGDPIAAAVIHALIPSGTKHDVTMGYGFGGGTDLRVSKHVSLRMQLDAAWSHPMDDLLGNGGWIYRAGVGPSFHFGREMSTRAK